MNNKIKRKKKNRYKKAKRIPLPGLEPGSRE